MREAALPVLARAYGWPPSVVDDLTVSDLLVLLQAARPEGVAGG